MPVAFGGQKKEMSYAWWRAGVRRTQGRAQRQLQAWPLHRRDDRLSAVAEASNSRGEGADQDRGIGCRRRRHKRCWTQLDLENGWLAMTTAMLDAKCLDTKPHEFDVEDVE